MLLLGTFLDPGPMVTPFIAAEFGGVILLILFPELSNWLPSLV